MSEVDDKLAEYRRKRDFTKTPEPYGDPIIDARRKIMPDSNDLLRLIAARTGAKVNEYRGTSDEIEERDREERYAAEASSEAGKRLREEMNYAAPQIGSSLFSGIGSAVGTMVNQSLARHAVATTAGVVLGVGVVGIVWGGKVVLKAYGPIATGWLISNIGSALITLLMAMYKNNKASTAELKTEAIIEAKDIAVKP